MVTSSISFVVSGNVSLAVSQTIEYPSRPLPPVSTAAVHCAVISGFEEHSNMEWVGDCKSVTVSGSISSYTISLEYELSFPVSV